MHRADKSNRGAEFFADADDLGVVGGLFITSLNRTEYLLNRAIGKVQGSRPLRAGSIGVLSLIVRHPGIYQNEIARRTLLDKSAVSLVVKDLEKQGWLCRRKIEGDRKRQALHATDFGAVELKKIVGAIRSIETRMLSEVPAHALDDLRRLLDQAHLSCLAQPFD